MSHCATAQLADRNYADLLSKSILLLEAQTCGPKPSFSRVAWRGDCHTTDGSEAGVDLVGGWHDAGDHVKFHYPLAQTVTMLSWSYLAYPESFANTGNQNHLMNNLRYIGDYLIKLHPSPNELWAQVALGNTDHQFWQVPEQNTYTRNVYKLTPNRPGTDLACGMAASFASLSMVFADTDPNYSATLLRHAKELYNFGDTYRGNYSDQVPDGKFYKSNKSFVDVLAWGALWLYKATGEQAYLNKAESAFAKVADQVGGWTIHFADQQYGSALLLAQIKGSDYHDEVERWLDGQIDNNRYTPGGLNYLNGFFPIPLVAATSFASYFYADLRGPGFSKYDKYRNFAFSQTNYILGDNPRNSSYVVGFGNNWPTRIHHRAAHSPEGGRGRINCCPDSDAHQLTGALVGGPDANDSFENKRSNVQQSEMSIATHAVFVGLVAQLVKESGATSPPPPAGTNTVTIRAKGDCGLEDMELRINGRSVASWQNIPTTFTDYSYDAFGEEGEVSVHFTNNNNPETGCADKNLHIDYITVCGTTYQTEAVATKTSTCCAESLDKLFTNGNFNFGTLSCEASEDEAPTEGNVMIRAKGSAGSETMQLLVDGNQVRQWTNVPTTATDYTYEGYRGGPIEVAFTNDGNDANGRDRNLAIDYLTVCGQKVQAERATRNVSCGNIRDGFVQLWCNSRLNFGDVGCASNTSASTKVSKPKITAQASPEVQVFPNPGLRGVFRVRGLASDREFWVTDLFGQVVLTSVASLAEETLDLSGQPDGVYLLRTSEGKTVKLVKE